MGKVSGFLASSVETQNIGFLLPNNKLSHSNSSNTLWLYHSSVGRKSGTAWLTSLLRLSQGWYQGAFSSGGAGEIHFQTQSGYWQNSVHCGCRIDTPTSGLDVTRLDVSWGPDPAPHSHCTPSQVASSKCKSAVFSWITLNLFSFSSFTRDSLV